jgi:hypothetical protein
MIKEINIDGVFLSPLIGYIAGTAIVWYGLRFVLRRLGVFRLVWHAPLFDTALFVILLGVFVAATS